MNIRLEQNQPEKKTCEGLNSCDMGKFNRGK